MNLFSIDDFRASARNCEKLEGTIQRLATGAATQVDGATRTLRFCFSDGTVDRAGDSINVEGWDLGPFQKNSVALWAHDGSAPPIGRASNVGVVGSRLMGDIEFASAETYEFADTIYRLCKDGFINAVSVGFIPKEWSFTKDKDRPYGIDFKKQELLEISVCPVPCNSNALAEARAKGIDTSPLRQWAEKVLDEGNSIIVPRTMLEEIFKDAKTPHSARAKYRALIEEKPEMPAPVKAMDEESASPLVATCGRAKDMECGMKDPAECAIHAPETKAVTTKAGRKISAANKAKLQEALDHHEKSAQCIRDVLGDDGDDDDDEDPNAEEPDKSPAAPEVQVEELRDDLSPAELRAAEVRAIRDALTK
jgi:HK97 family phage prohead protease